MTGLLTAEARAWLGTEVHLASGVITPEIVARYVTGAGLEGSHRCSVAAGLEPRIVAPPLLCLALTRPIHDLEELTPDGVTSDRRPPVGTGQGMAGDMSLEFVTPLYVGDSATGRRVLTDLVEKTGSRRAFVLARWETEYRNQNDELLVREVANQLLF